MWKLTSALVQSVMNLRIDAGGGINISISFSPEARIQQQWAAALKWKIYLGRVFECELWVIFIMSAHFIFPFHSRLSSRQQAGESD